MPSTPPVYQVHLALIATQIFFASLSVVGKQVGLELPWPAFATLRIGLSALLFWGLKALFTDQKVRREDLKVLALYGFLAVAANQIQFLAGLTRSKATHATILVTSIPVFSAVLAALLGREHLTSRKSLGVVVSLAGAVGLVVSAALASGKDVSFDSGQLTGNLLIISNSLCYALYLVLSKDLLSRYNAIVVTTWMFVFGFLETLAFDLVGALLFPEAAAQAWNSTLSASLATWIRLLYIVLLPTVGAYTLNSWALRFAPMSLVSVYIYVQPIVTASLAYLLLGELLYWQELLAAMFIIIGVGIVARENAKKSAAQAPQEK